MSATRDLAIITGASSGLGAALAAAVPMDADVIDVSRRGGTPGTEHWALDLADPAAWPDLESRLTERLAGHDGTIVCIHNAGTITPIGYAGEVDSAGYATQVLINAAAPQAVGHAFLAALRGAADEARGHLWMISSGAAKKPYEGWSAYCAGKAAVDLWVRTAGAEQATRGGRCRVLAVAPGVLATPMQDQIRVMDPGDFPAVDRFIGLHRDGDLRDPDETAAQLWTLLERDDLDNGAVIDLRNL